MKEKQILRIVLSSPGDVIEERQVMENVIAELNGGIADDRNLRLELSRWETDAYPGLHSEGPQGLIDPILKIEDSDILLGIFWKRFGTPTKDALSGTEHEIRVAIKSWEQYKQPQIMIYFKEAQFLPQTEEELEQHKLVLRFRKEFPKEGLYWTFRDVSEFERLTRIHLSNFIRSQFDLYGAESELSPLKTDVQSFIRDYCRRIQHRFSTIYLFGSQQRPVGDNETALDRMSSIEQGFFPCT